MAAQLDATTTPAPTRRRKRAECEPRILEAARAIFAEQGYDGATTREIARRATVSETLLFRYFGSKAALFDRILFAPVSGLMSSFLITHSARDIDEDPVASTRDFLNALLAFADAHRTLLAAYAARTMTGGDGASGMTGLTGFYELAAGQVQRMHAVRGGKPDVAPDLAVRLSLGMVIAPILFEPWLFPEGPPTRSELVEGLARLLVNANLGRSAGQ